MFDDFIVDYLEGALAPAQRSLFERHLWFCRDCRAYLDRYRRTLDLGRRVCLEPGEPVPVDVPEDLVRAVLAAAAAEDEK